MSVFHNFRNLFAATRSEEHSIAPGRHHVRDEPPSSRFASRQFALASRTARYLNAHMKSLIGKMQHKDKGCRTRDSAPVQETAVYQRFIPIRLLGAGGNGQVHLSHDSRTGAFVAVKTIRHDDSVPAEVQILRLLDRHDNIVHFITVQSDPSIEGRLQLAFEHCDGDLTSLIDANTGSLPELFIWHAFKQITNGLHYIHSQQIVHSDIKPANILLTPSDRELQYPTLKIADFGTAAIDPPTNIPRGHMATMGWQPPESVHRTGPEIDIWSLGTIIFELVARRLPLEKVKKPNVDPETWFELHGKSISPGTRNETAYKHFCHFMAYHPAAPRRIDMEPLWHGSDVVYSKLLNFFMMRALDTDYRTRISTDKLHRHVDVLETLAYQLTLSGRESMLNKFKDGRDECWRQSTVSPVTESHVVLQLFIRLNVRAHRTKNAELCRWAMPLLELMESREVSAAATFLQGLP